MIGSGEGESKEKGKTVVQWCMRVSSHFKIQVGQVDRWGRRGIMDTGRGRGKRRVLREWGGEGKGDDRRGSGGERRRQ